MGLGCFVGGFGIFMGGFGGISFRFIRGVGIGCQRNESCLGVLRASRQDVGVVMGRPCNHPELCVSFVLEK